MKYSKNIWAVLKDLIISVYVALNLGFYILKVIFSKVLATNHSSKENFQGVIVFTAESSVIGYVTNLMPVSPSHDYKRKYFQFTLRAENIEQRVVCFSMVVHWSHLK